ncbi:class I SAM-dependent methyltransferase [Planctomycetota bacterium]|nr:class I SAM-dependent methyltransferase [Planctomycetota bacterium]
MSDAEREKWNAKYRQRAGQVGPPSALVTELGDLLPRRGRALDLAGGSGRHGVWLAERGLDVTVCDVSREGLSAASAHGLAKGVALQTLQVDLDAGVPAGPWDLILSFHYLNRALFPQFAAALAPGGVLVFAQPTTTNLERHARPGRAFLLEPGELATLIAPEFEVIRLDEGWLGEDRHEARVVAKRLG